MIIGNVCNVHHNPNLRLQMFSFRQKKIFDLTSKPELTNCVFYEIILSTLAFDFVRKCNSYEKQVDFASQWFAQHGCLTIEPTLHFYFRWKNMYPIYFLFTILSFFLHLFLFIDILKLFIYSTWWCRYSQLFKLNLHILYQSLKFLLKSLYI